MAKNIQSPEPPWWKPTRDRIALGILAGLLIFVVFPLIVLPLFLTITSAPEDSRRHEDYYKGRVEFILTDDLVVPLTGCDSAKWTHLELIADQPAIEEMRNDGRLILVRSGTKVQAMEPEERTGDCWTVGDHQVKLLDGKYAGTVCLIGTTDLNRAKYVPE